VVVRLDHRPPDRATAGESAHLLRVHRLADKPAVRDRPLGTLLLTTGILLIAAQAAFKDWPTAEEIRRYARSLSEPLDWRDRVAPDFELTLRDGSTFRLSDVVGRRVIVLNFFATWCGPCKKEMPELQRYYDAHAKAGMLLLGIDAEEKPALVDDFVRELALTFPVAVDETGDVLKAYGVSSFPTTVVIGADGRVKLRETGAIMNADVALDPVVRPELEPATAGRGITKDAYLAALKAAPPPKVDGAPALDARAQNIASAMPCPCGCSDRVAQCGCQTAKGIKARLARGGFANRTDAEVMQEINREFCMKGM
jgi:peroxiredoxin